MDPSQMMPRSFPMWPPPPPPAASDAMPPPPLPLPQPFLAPPQPNRGWKRKNNPNNNPNLAGGGAYQPPAIGDLQVQNRAKARRWFNNPNNAGGGGNPNNAGGRKYFFPKSNKGGNKAKAPRNTTSFIIRAKRAGGIASLVSPCPVTPAVLPTPRISPSREGLSDMAQQQWGVDGYGSMKGLIRLRASSPRHPDAEGDDDDSSSGSDVEEHVEVERRLDHDLSRFEMVYPGGMANGAAGYVLEDDQDVHVARLEEENLTLKERLFLMEQEVGDMRRRLEAIEARFAGADGVAAAGSADNAALVLQQRADADAENGVDAAPVAGDAVIVSLEDANANASGAENANLLEKAKGDAASASDDTVEDALKIDTEMDVAASASANAVEFALKNDTEMGVAASASANAVEFALKNDTEMGDAGNLVEEALENVTAMADAVSGADNAVKESDMNRGDVEQEKSGEDMAGAGSEKNAEMADTTGSGEEEGKEQA
ncbi:unnamed protein product [Triticum turgidum subsp. durum]|uniref:PRLI-interacting factor A n=1 Tax=Triticum turgidum subsp. durum TaxID=4567 RepID=A0A9R1B5J3_TRITD|nr:unnamed protein product [Triticum turgidum subsp. durum]